MREAKAAVSKVFGKSYMDSYGCRGVKTHQHQKKAKKSSWDFCWKNTFATNFLTKLAIELWNQITKVHYSCWLSQVKMDETHLPESLKGCENSRDV